MEGTLSPATDVFSFGVVLWEMWAGRRAWQGLSGVQVLQAVTASGRTLEPVEGAPAYLEVRASGWLAVVAFRAGESV
jgi:hypothetical protein